MHGIFPSLNPPLRDWRDRRVWLIGASSGIGAALAQALLARGARVALSARNQAALDEMAVGRPQVLVLPMDATDPAAWGAANAILQANWGGIDLVVFCAAEYRPERAWEIDSDHVHHTLSVNLASVYYGLEAILPTLIAQQHGSIALVASVAGYMGLPGATVYGPSKAALINLAELLYCDLKPRGIGVFLINPGFVKTRLTARNRFTMPALLTPEQAAEAILAGLARGRFEIDFPRRFTAILQLLRLLPYRWRFYLLNRTLNLP
ncbi:Short-chain dehydrogenase [Andreprevotia lacus DSM 23236]|jgi:NAD(P)-dependent dehydrogenase (short-subunit alcohol dehydrogenase family)|uniref:Short-chain dehydrogenase n=1 Tax=Andreprevotia lacus DSM 23236 TaxID=1121001 RepID=A0A1W1XQL5_9NEIS|nr:SDR family NAD(P)-dependent oxidoreductase [Andreprevotia lacus]SMC26152.1 Short-chain dehydrogenase [Andreprevotia lacus DSM 23236]